MRAARLDVLYRGPLSSCNYDCAYCPFAKRASTREELAHDRDALARFTEWAERVEDRELGVLFTPWGEALIRSHYRESIVRLSHAPHVAKLAAQTNLSCDLEWLARARVERVALWATYHPGQTPHARFVAKCVELERAGVRFSVGIVGLAAHVAAAERLRRELPDGTYLWVNAAKSSSVPLDAASHAAFARIDPLFAINTVHHRSLGEPCRTGERVVSVDGSGDVRRCHFVATVLGNIHRDRLDHILGERPCPNARCGCHIGYVHLDRLGLREVFGDGTLERIPRASRALRVLGERELD